jgi:hypothetical protein
MLKTGLSNSKAPIRIVNLKRAQMIIVGGLWLFEGALGEGLSADMTWR